MKIVILNECFLNEEHLKELRTLGDVTVYTDTISEKDAIERLKYAEIALVDTFFAPLNKKTFESSKNLKFIALNSTGYDPVDLKAAKEHNIRISNLPGYSTDAVAEHAIALMFATIRKIPLADKEMRIKPFETDPGREAHRKYRGFQLDGKTLGIIGLGSIGIRTASIGRALGMKVIAYNRTPKKIVGIEQKELKDILKDSDIVSLHLPLMPGLENMISEQELAMMKPNAVLINTARGKLVNTKALFEALKSKKIAGAGLDMLAEWDTSNPLLTLDNIVLTPHSAYYTEESIRNMGRMILKNVESFINGSPINLIS